MKSFFSFPNPVNEVSARIVAGGVVVMALLVLTLHQPWLIGLIAYGFVARTLTGPTLSPLGQLATRVITPRLGVAAKYVPGPPKRFAQSCGAVLSLLALLLAFGFGLSSIAYILMGILAVLATLESVFAFCVGCKIFGALMALGIIPQSVCVECSNIWARSSSQPHGPVGD
ncbi:MAG: DUF4395 domain-containing protein [Herpetosiphonaceae bacterium]|nr:DUF4395 domain-containing protein [Herpetosiphonaceae bacterium]